MYFDQIVGQASVSTERLADARADVFQFVSRKVFEEMAARAREAGVPDFRDSDVDSHLIEQAQTPFGDVAEVRMYWNPQPGHIELLGGAQDGLLFYLTDPDRDVIVVPHPESSVPRLFEVGEGPVESTTWHYRRWKINGLTRKWVYRFEGMR